MVVFKICRSEVARSVVEACLSSGFTSYFLRSLSLRLVKLVDFAIPSLALPTLLPGINGEVVEVRYHFGKDDLDSILFVFAPGMCKVCTWNCYRYQTSSTL